MHILVIPGSFDGANLGDIAMLRSAMERLRGLWPGASFRVLARDWSGLKPHCGDASPVPMRGCRQWLKRNHRSSYSDFLPGGRQAQQFEVALSGSDLLVLAGSGMLNDDFQGAEARVLRVFQAAHERGIPTAMVGQGIGPIRGKELLDIAKKVLPGVGFFLVREPLASIDLLHACGVADDNIFVTGDDAIELAWRRRATSPGKAIGVNLRVADYSGLVPGVVGIVRDTLMEKSRELDARLIGIPILTRSRDSDLSILRQIVPGFRQRRPEWTLNAVFDHVSQCRVVVAGSYHAAVFALSQGIPVVAVAQSEYYKNKFAGLAAQFGEGCVVLAPETAFFSSDLGTALHDTWTASEDLRPCLLAAAERQINDGRATYKKLFTLVSEAIPAKYKSP